MGLADAPGGIFLVEHLIGGIVKLLGRLSESTLSYSFRDFKETITVEEFKEMLRSADNYRYPMKLEADIKLPIRYIEAFNAVTDLKATLASLHFDLHGDGGVPHTYLMA